VGEISYGRLVLRQFPVAGPWSRRYDEVDVGFSRFLR